MKKRIFGVITLSIALLIGLFVISGCSNDIKKEFSVNKNKEVS